jgi:predicted DsbA family dithiol-disulfide isomerase
LTDGSYKITVPRQETIKKGTLLSIIQQAGMTKEEFLKSLEKRWTSDKISGDITRKIPFFFL